MKVFETLFLLLESLAKVKKKKKKKKSNLINKCKPTLS